MVFSVINFNKFFSCGPGYSAELSKILYNPFWKDCLNSWSKFCNVCNHHTLQAWYGNEESIKVSKGAKIRDRYNQVPHPTQDTNGKVSNSQLDTTNESQEVSPFPAGDHKAQLNRRAQRHNKHKTEQKHKRSTKEVPPWNGQ